MDISQIKPLGHRVMVELHDQPTTNPRGGLHLPGNADTRGIAPRLATVLALPEGVACGCPHCLRLDSNPPSESIDSIAPTESRRYDAAGTALDIAVGDTVLLQIHGGTAVDLRGASVDLVRSNVIESKVKTVLVLMHQVLAVVEPRNRILNNPSLYESQLPKVTGDPGSSAPIWEKS